MTEYTVEVMNFEDGDRVYIEQFSDKDEACDKYTEMVDVYGDEIEYDVYIYEDGDMLATTAFDEIDEDVSYYKNYGGMYAFA